MTHDPQCSGCPRCNPDLAAIMTDTQVGRWHALSTKLRTMTRNALRFRPSAAPTPAPDLSSALTATPVDVASAITRGQSAIGPRVSSRASTSTIAPPDLAAAIKEHRRA